MRKLLLAVTLLASFAVPAAADQDASADDQGDAAIVSDSDASVDTMTTRSIVKRDAGDKISCIRGSGIDPLDNPQCEFFGGNNK